MSPCVGKDHTRLPGVVARVAATVISSTIAVVVARNQKGAALAVIAFVRVPRSSGYAVG